MQEQEEQQTKQWTKRRNLYHLGREHTKERANRNFRELLSALQGNGQIRHVETCPDFFSLQEYTQQNTVSKF
jgi:hypothetical protein